MDIIVHADDFGLTLDQSKDILACSSACGGEGALNSTSAIVTSAAFAESAEFTKPFVDAGLIRMGLHLNLVEGRALSTPSEIPLLVDAEGRFRQSFAGLLALSFGPERIELEQQVRTEATAQLQEFLRAFPEARGRLRVDSHQHTHMIPAVFRGLLSAVRSEGCTLEHVRIPAERLQPYMQARGVRANVPPVNVVKNLLLNWLSAQAANGGQPVAFYGLALSGRMQHALDEEFLQLVLADAHERGQDVELLFHPGGLASLEECPAPKLSGFVEFNLSPNRAHEAEALRKLPALL